MLERIGPEVDWSALQYYHRYSLMILSELDLRNIIFLSQMFQMGERADKKHWLCVDVRPRSDDPDQTESIGLAYFSTVYESYTEFSPPPYLRCKRVSVFSPEGTHALIEWQGDHRGTIIFSPVEFNKFGRPTIADSMLKLAASIIASGSSDCDGVVLATALGLVSGIPTIADYDAELLLISMKELRLVKPAKHFPDKMVMAGVSAEDFTDVFGIKIEKKPL